MNLWLLHGAVTSLRYTEIKCDFDFQRSRRFSVRREKHFLARYDLLEKISKFSPDSGKFDHFQIEIHDTCNAYWKSLREQIKILI